MGASGAANTELFSLVARAGVRGELLRVFDGAALINENIYNSSPARCGDYGIAGGDANFRRPSSARRECELGHGFSDCIASSGHFRCKDRKVDCIIGVAGDAARSGRRSGRGGSRAHARIFRGAAESANFWRFIVSGDLLAGEKGRGLEVMEQIVNH